MSSPCRTFSSSGNGYSDNGEVMGDFMPVGIRPKFAERLAVTGIPLPASMFEISAPSVRRVTARSIRASAARLSAE